MRVINKDCKPRDASTHGAFIPVLSPARYSSDVLVESDVADAEPHFSRPPHPSTFSEFPRLFLFPSFGCLGNASPAAVSRPQAQKTIPAPALSPRWPDKLHVSQAFISTHAMQLKYLFLLAVTLKDPEAWVTATRQGVRGSHPREGTKKTVASALAEVFAGHVTESDVARYASAKTMGCSRISSTMNTYHGGT